MPTPGRGSPRRHDLDLPGDAGHEPSVATRYSNTLMDIHPKVFIIHASEDKERFVLSFYDRLRAKGIDAWLDTFEMLPGDKLVTKVFEEGLKQSDAVIVVLSAVSTAKPFVRKELDAAVIKSINEKTAPIRKV